MPINKHFLRVIAITGFFLLLPAMPAPVHAQDVVGLQSMLAAKQCPPSEFSRISYDDRSCGFSAQKACDQQYRAPSQAWQDCYHQLDVCRKQADADNQVITEANRVYRSCHQPKSNSDQSATGMQPKAGGSSAGSDNLQHNSTSSDLASRLATQRRKNATAADVQRQQDQQFSDIVRTQQQQYQQAKAAREQAEQAAREREAREQTPRVQERTQQGGNEWARKNRCANECIDENRSSYDDRESCITSRCGFSCYYNCSSGGPKP
jgi:hypothetical protein